MDIDGRVTGIARLRKAIFLERPTCFLVRCRLDSGGQTEAFLPNPGRLWELLLPGATLYLTRSPPTRGAISYHRRTRYTAVAVERGGAPVFLHTMATNRVARYLLENRLIPSLENAQVVRTEVPVGRSRLDFLLREEGRDMYAEVKSVTLFGNGVAMFPDAVTDRGRRHLLTLGRLAREGNRSLVLFLVHTPKVHCFMPDYHSDFAFSKALLSVRGDVRIIPVALTWRSALSFDHRVKLLDIPWGYLQRQVKDRGSYLLLLRLASDKNVDVGALGRIQFAPGYYVYVGSAMRGLSARIARHRRKRKRPRWHVDYLRREADGFLALPIRSSRREECDVARALSAVLNYGPVGFGSSDCRCKTHLFWIGKNPLDVSAFHTVLQRFRMAQP